jgi:hypothetical protein
MKRFASYMFAPAILVVGAATACSSSPTDSGTESSNQALVICNCPLETGGASCICGGPTPLPDAGRCVSPPGGPCGGFTQDPCTCAPGSKCIPNRIPDIPGTCAVCDPVVCPAGETWDGALCECVPGCLTAADCHGALPDLCKVCADGSDGCAHWACVDQACEIEFCDSTSISPL